MDDLALAVDSERSMVIDSYFDARLGHRFQHSTTPYAGESTNSFPFFEKFFKSIVAIHRLSISERVLGLFGRAPQGLPKRRVPAQCLLLKNQQIMRPSFLSTLLLPQIRLRHQRKNRVNQPVSNSNGRGS